jgi:3'-phosphoadenosine 5'-phosphosulfate sulfotransferase (PAPS reductase)/FAD synthetase
LEQENIHTKEQLKELQALPLERKVQITQSRIIEWYKYYNGQVYVSLSGGKDSTVLLHIARQLFPDIEAVYVDTGLEYPELREFVKSIDNVTWLKPEMNFRQVLDKYGYSVISKEVSRDVGRTQKNGGINSRTGEYTYAYKLLNDLYYDKQGRLSMFSKGKWRFLIDAPFKVSNQCCDVMKKKPLHSYEKINNKKSIIGTMASESMIRQTEWIRTGCNAFDNKSPQSKPMSFWTENDVLEYIVKNELKICFIIPIQTFCRYLRSLLFRMEH